MEIFGPTARAYRDFARYAVDSATFQAWSLGVAADPEVRRWLESLPEAKRQPNLVFAAARWHGVPAPGPYQGLRTALLADRGEIRATILTRATQTNEVGRLATLVPAFARLEAERPLALIEVGASAGLCLYPDQWGYLWQTDDGPSLLGGDPRLVCEVTGAWRAPRSLPEVAWRGGLDLNPLDVRDEDQMLWLETLVWPEAEQRRAQLRHGIELATTTAVDRMVTGNLLTDLDDLIAEARRHGEVVVFHSAVTAYLSPTDRACFAAQMNARVRAGRCHWISNEGKNVHPEITSTGPPIPPELTTFVLGVDGRAVAWTHGHGSQMSVLPGFHPDP